MSLLSGLLDHMPPTIAGDDKPTVTKPTTERTRLVLAERQATVTAYTNAASATPEWRHARDQYISHVMACRACYAPTARHCPAGADLRATYDRRPMEPHQ